MMMLLPFSKLDYLQLLDLLRYCSHWVWQAAVRLRVLCSPFYLWNLICLDLSPCPLTSDLQHWNNYFVFMSPVYPQMEGIFRKAGVLSVAGCACDQEQADFFYKCLLILYSLSDEWLMGENLGLTFRRIMPSAAFNRRNCVPLQGCRTWT